MLTPKFSLSQTDTQVCVTIHAPYTNIDQTDIYVDGTDFIFYSKPYYLRLKLPGEITDLGTSDGNYNASEGAYVLKLEKVNKGEHFPNLDMLSTLIVKKPWKFQWKAPIEVLDSTEGDTNDSSDNVNWLEGHDEENSNCDEEESVLDSTREEVVASDLLNKPKYGFGNKFSNVFKGYTFEVYEILDLIDPDIIPASSRSQLRTLKETSNFSEDHYLADLMEEEDVIENILSYLTPSEKLKSFENLSDDDNFRLKNILVVEHLLDSSETESVFFGILDIMLAFCYDLRITEEDTTSESAWTINKLSATFSWFETFHSEKEVLISFIRRSLIYPLHRNWKLSLKVIDDTCILFKIGGKQQILKNLLKIHKLFNLSSPRFLLNLIYVEHYIIWIQKIDNKELINMAENIGKITLTKDDLDLDIVELEHAAELVLEEENDRVQKSDNKEQNTDVEVQLEEELAKLHLSDNRESESEHEDSSSEDSESSSSEDDSSDSDDSSLDSDDTQG